VSPAQEWEAWRKKRTSGAVSTAEWLEWAERYVSGLTGGPWRSHCEAHIRFVRRNG